MPCSYETVTRFVKPEGEHRVPFHAFCEICTVEVPACQFCFTRPQSLDSWCAPCHNSYNGTTFTPQPAEKPRFLCEECELMERCAEMYGSWNTEPRNEIVAYSYKPVCKCCPLSSTNYKRMPITQPIIVNRPRTPLKKRQTEAWVAYRKELDFSKNQAEALIVYSSFFSSQLSGTLPLEHEKQAGESKLSLREILRGQDFPTNRQFLRAVVKKQEREKRKVAEKED
jgi:hypothetical protein